MASNKYPENMFLWRNKKNYPRIFTQYSSSLAIPEHENFIVRTELVQFDCYLTESNPSLLKLWF